MSSFHYDFILSKRGSLARVWLAAHWEKKLSKVQIFETNLQKIVQDILHPKTPIALRTSSHLLVGLVRIYSRKAKYLLQDCSDTLVNIKVAFRPGVSSLDKPAKQRKSVKEIVDCPIFITERVDLLDQWVPEVSSVELDCTLNQSRIEEITLQEEPMKVSSLEDYFDDEGFGEMDAESSDITGRTLNSCTSLLERGCSFADSAYGTDDQALTETTSLTDYYSDPFSSTLTPIKDFENSPCKKTTDQRPTLLFDLDVELHPEECCITSPLENRNETTITEDTLVLELDLDVPDDMEENGQTGESRDLQGTPSTSQLDKEEQSLKRSLEDQEDVVILDPVEISQKKAYSPRKRHKRKLLIDEVISIDRQVMYDNMSDPSRFLRMPDFAARSKKQMKQEERNQTLLSKGSILELSPALEKLFELKCRKFSTSSNVSSEVVSSNQSSEQESDQTGFGNNEDLSCNRFSGNSGNNQPDELDLSEQFIPLQDTEYSSDEECPLGNRLRDNTLNEFDFADNTLTMEEQTVEIVDENISDDKFCSFVETTVLQSHSGAVTFRHVVGKDDGKLTRKTVARRFLKCLLMQRDARLSLEQKESFQEILLRPGLKHPSEEV